MQINEIKYLSTTDIQDIQSLLTTLSPNSSFSKENLNSLLRSPESHLYGLYDQDKLIGCCCLGIYHSITGKKACLEDVVVLPEYQGQGGGRMLVSYATEEARRQGVSQLLFTSKPSRIKANRLYQSMDFEKKETNVYIKKW